MSSNHLTLKCFQCLQVIPDPDDLFKHLKNVHGICGNSDFKCSLCLADIESFGSFKIHTKSVCLKKKKEAEDAQHTAQVNEEFDTTAQINEALNLQYDLRMEYFDAVSEFEEQVQRDALDLVLNMSANMSIPRSLVFQTLAQFQTFISKTYIHGTFICFLRSVFGLKFVFTYLMQV